MKKLICHCCKKIIEVGKNLYRIEDNNYCSKKCVSKETPSLAMFFKVDEETIKDFGD